MPPPSTQYVILVTDNIDLGSPIRLLSGIRRDGVPVGTLEWGLAATLKFSSELMAMAYIKQKRDDQLVRCRWSYTPYPASQLHS